MKQKTATIMLTLSLLLISLVSADDMCRALALSGGGAMGAYEAGALWGLYYALENKTDMTYDVVTGVSAGSINMGGVALFDKGDEEELVKFLSFAWQNLTSDDVYKNWWPLSVVQGVMFHSGIFNNQPLTDYLTELMLPKLPFKRKYMISAVDINTGSYHVFNESSNTDYVKQVISSASIPFVFPHQHWPKEHLVLMDGGTVWNTNMVSAI